MPPTDPEDPPDPELQQRACDVFASLFARPAADRTAAVAAACGDDHSLRAAVERLLRDHDMPPPILTRALAANGGSGDDAAGRTIGPYRLLHAVGRGGMGIVYRAEQERPRRTVAVKVLSPGCADGETMQRFAREVEVLGLLQHPGICRIYGAGAADLGFGLGETPYFAMEFVDGVPLTKFAAQHGLDVDARCALLAQVCDAVQHAHDHGVVHRDLKPGNILVTTGPEGAPLAKVLDFGIARAIQVDALDGPDTRTGTLLGTLPYMSPEQLNGSARNIDARSDVYALGVLLYELLAGRLPLLLDDLPLATACRLVAEREPPPLGSLDRRLRGDLTTIAQKALQKDREDRYDGAGALGLDLRRFLRHEPILAERQRVTYQLRKFARRHRTLVGSALAVLLALAVGIVGIGLLAARNDALATREAEARRVAENATERLRQALYRSQMRLGSEAMAVPGGIARVREIAAPWLPTAAGGATEDLRGFEWHLLWASSHRELEVRAAEPTPQALCWTADGSRVVTSHWQSVVSRPASGDRDVRRFVSPVEPLAPSAFGPRSTGFVQAVTPSTLQWFDLATGAGGRTFAHAGEVHRAVLSPDGGMLGAYGPDFGIVVWDTATGRRLAGFGTVFGGAMAFAADGAWFALARAPDASGIEVEVFATDDWTAPQRELHGSPEFVLHLAFAANGALLAASSHEGRLRIWDLASTRLLHEFLHQDELRGLAFDPASRRIAVGCRDYLTYVYDLQAGTATTLPGHTGIVAAVAWSPTGDELLTIGDDATLRRWNPSALAPRRTYRLATTASLVHCQLAWSGDSRSLAAAGDFVAPTTIQVETGERSPGFRTTHGGVTWQLDPAGGEVARFDAGAGEAAPARLQPGPFRFAVASADGSRVVMAAGAREPLRLWRVGGDVRTTAPLPSDVRGICWLGASRLALVDSYDTVRILDGDDGRELAVREVPECTLAIASAPDGTTLAIGCVDQAVRLWHPGEADMLALRGHTGHVEALAFAADGRRLASGGRDGTVRIWDPVAGAEVAALDIGSHVVAVAWSPDGQRLAALRKDGELVVWDSRLQPHAPPAAATKSAADSTGALGR